MTQTAPRTSAARPRVRIATLVAVVLTAVSVGEMLGWPFLEQPLAKLASSSLERRVTLGVATERPGAAALTPARAVRGPEATGSSVGVAAAGPDESAESDEFAIRFVGGLRVRLPRLSVAAPVWSDHPHLLLARGLDLRFRYADIWKAYRGQPLRFARLHADLLDAELERLADGRASWRVQADPAAGPAVLPVVDDLQVREGLLRYRDAPLAIDVDGRLSLRESSAAASPAGDLHLTLSGTYRKLPLEVDLLASGVQTDRAAGSRPVPLSVNATVGRSHFAFDGHANDGLRLDHISGRFQLQGPSLAAVGDPLGVTLPTTGPFSTNGVLVRDGGRWCVRVDAATVGSSRLNGAFVFDAAGGLPRLAGRLGGSRLLLTDLGPALGTARDPAAAQKAPTPGKVLPARPFDLAALRAMNANVLIDIAEVDLSTPVLQPLRPLRAHLRLEGGVLSLNNLEARTAQGRLTGGWRLDGRGQQALWDADLRWDGVQLGQWIRQARAEGAPPYISGQLQGRATLKGQGRSTAEILGSLDGRVRTELSEGRVSHLLVEAAGLDIAQAIGVALKADDALPVGCGVADLTAKDGVFRPRVMVLDTTDSAVWIDGTMSLAAESLDLRAVVSPKDFSPLTLRAPVRVRGSFADPSVTLEAAPLGRKLGAAALLALLNPLAALLPLIDGGDTDDALRNAAACRRLMQRAPAPPAS